MDERYALLLNGKKIGTVHLDPARRGQVRARLAPLPAFRGIARHRKALAVARERTLNEEDPTRAELAAADGAQAVLDSLRLSLATDPGGLPVAVKEINLLRRDPPHVQISW